MEGDLSAAPAALPDPEATAAKKDHTRTLAEIRRQRDVVLAENALILQESEAAESTEALAILKLRQHLVERSLRSLSIAEQMTGRMLHHQAPAPAPAPQHAPVPSMTVNVNTAGPQDHHGIPRQLLDPLPTDDAELEILYQETLEPRR